MRGTLQATNLRVVGFSGNPPLTERQAEKLPLEESPSPTDKAEAPAKDTLVKKTVKRKLRSTYANKDPREVMRTLRRGNRNYIDTFEELLDGLEINLEVCNHSPSPKHFGGQK